MPQFFLNKRLIILLICVIILVALIGFSLRDREQVTWPEQFIKDTVGWVQSIVHQPAQYVAGFFENVNDLKNTYEENKMLKARLEEYVALKDKYQILEQDYEELSAILEKTTSLTDYTPIQATVIGRNPDQWYQNIYINKGEKHGVKVDMAVITSKGLIGKVKQTSQFKSTIQLLSDTNQNRINRVAAVVLGEDEESNVDGVIEGYDDEREALLLKLKKATNIEVKVDQDVITSGLGGVFPSGLPIGKVIDVVPDESGLLQLAYVKPEANFSAIDHVIVLERTMTPVDIEGEE
ncbi:rod shape-determining protein MreC [Bacillus sp. SM2101]|uniref:rod shape-determining protein MreC n=1 Tax=Bacillus sp. SM2101 TaxID=2805366 RepID=UPI001BDF1103|nr:rod shape-determining protein MreC [Bacillus sp. SM2101]